MMWIVMTSSAAMPAGCWGRYRRVALVKVDQWHTARDMVPARISERTRGILRLIDMGHHNVGTTPRSAYQRTLAEAQRRAIELNNAPTVEAGDELLASWGGSA
jgi:hypothetical protein